MNQNPMERMDANISPMSESPTEKRLAVLEENFEELKRNVFEVLKSILTTAGEFAEKENKSKDSSKTDAQPEE